VRRETGDALTTDVKGVANRDEWSASNVQSSHPEHHFVVLVSSHGHRCKSTAEFENARLLITGEATVQSDESDARLVSFVALVADLPHPPKVISP
jgi:hypothetical protein